MELRYPLGARYVLLAFFGVIFISLSSLIYVYQPSEIITSQIIKFAPGSTIFQFWETPPYEVFVKIYIFNVTNPEEFLNGKQKIRLQEVGPYTYREILYNTNATFNENGTLTFIPKRKLEFCLNNSIGDALVDRFTLPNIALLGFTSYLQDASMFTNLAFSSITSYLRSQPFVNITVQEYLLGYNDPLIKLANNLIPNWIDFQQLGILDRIMARDNASELVTMNIKLESDYSILTNEKNVLPYAIERWSNSPGLEQWGYEEGESDSYKQNLNCNSVEGAFMGTLFPQNLDVNQTIRLFRPSFCRSVPFHYMKSGLNKDGYEVSYFKVDPKFLLRKENNSENACFCQKSNPNDCPRNGVVDASPCYYGIPVAMSQPHFLNADPSISSKFDGLFPDEEKHGLRFAVHPQLGIPMEAHMKIQLNLIIPETRYNYKTRPFNNHVLPLMWIDLTLEDVPSEVKFYLTLLYHVIPLVQDILMFSFGIIGVMLLCVSSALAVLTILSPTGFAGIKFGYSLVPLINIKEKQIKCLSVS